MTFASVPRWLVSTLLLSCFLCAGCDRPFQPYLENSNIPFSLLGYLDLEADTQWVRVMPVRQNLILGPDSIDAVVTLAKVGSGHPVTMRDSLFDYIDPRLGATVYAHNFWTTERLDPGAEYEIRAVRSDGAATTAHLTMPPHLEFSLLSAAGAGLLRVRATRILFVEVIYTMGLPYDSMGGLYYEPASSVVERAPAAQPTAEPGTQALELYATGEEERRRAAVAVVSHGMWQRRFGGSPDVIGRTVDIGGVPFRVIGVMPRDFAFPDEGSQLWLPWTLFTDFTTALGDRGTGSWSVVGRLRPGVELPAARRELRVLASDWSRRTGARTPASSSMRSRSAIRSPGAPSSSHSGRSSGRWGWCS